MVKYGDFIMVLEKIHFKPICVAEVGSFMPETTQTRFLIDQGVETWLFECLPRAVSALRKKWSHLSHVHIVNTAISGDFKTVEMMAGRKDGIIGGPLSYIVGSGSWAETRKRYEKLDHCVFPVSSAPFSAFDHGQFDAICIDVEGCEYDVLSTMVSRPRLLQLEIRAENWKNAQTAKIVKWLDDHDYVIRSTPTDLVCFREPR